MKRTFRFQFLLLGMLIPGFLPVGCVNKYCRVTDTASGRAYYTVKVQKDKKTGVVSFVDVVSGAPMAFTNAQATPVSRAQFDQALHPK